MTKPTNHTCANCGAETIRATMISDEHLPLGWICVDPDWEYGGTISVKAGPSGRLFARDIGTSPKVKRLIEHDCTVTAAAAAQERDQ